MKRLKMRPIAEDEGLSWQQLCERLDTPPTPKPEQLPIFFDELEQRLPLLEAQPDDRAPPLLFVVSPEAHNHFDTLGVTRWPQHYQQ